MLRPRHLALVVSVLALSCREVPDATSPSRPSAANQSNGGNGGTHNPTWWDKYQYLAANGPMNGGGPTASSLVAGNVDVSDECGPQSETFITLNPNSKNQLAAGSNEIFRLPMRA